MSENQVITIASVGDISFAGGFASRPELFNSWLDDEVRAFLQADVTIGNLEYVMLPDGEEWPGGLCLAEPAESAQALAYAGFNVLTLANNHILDFKGTAGMLATMRHLDALKIRYCGAGMTLAEAQKPALLQAKGRRIAVFSRLHDYSFINVKPITAGEKTPGVALLDLAEISASMARCRKEDQADIVVLCLHWGMQNLHDHSRLVHELGRQLLENGADLVLGSHSHVVQGLAAYNGKFCFYGQGNFYFYPYPLAGQPNGVLYGPEAIRHRTAAASRFTYDGKQWQVETIVTRQGRNERVTALPDSEAGPLRRKLTGPWACWRPLVFHGAWRCSILRRDLCGFFRMLIRAEFKGIGWYLNPLNWIRSIIRPESLG